eukprot:9495061-Pyramimonas_sp.AAC.1
MFTSSSSCAPSAPGPFWPASSRHGPAAASPDISGACANDGSHNPPCVGPWSSRAARRFTGSFLRDRDNRTMTRLCRSSGDM